MDHRAGIQHRAADALSRLPTNATDITPLENELPLLATKTPGSTDTITHLVDMVSSTHHLLDAKRVVSDSSDGMIDILATPTTTKFIR